MMRILKSRVDYFTSVLERCVLFDTLTLQGILILTIQDLLHIWYIWICCNNDNHMLIKST